MDLNYLRIYLLSILMSEKAIGAYVNHVKWSIYGSNAVKVFALFYSPKDIYAYDFNTTVDNVRNESVGYTQGRIGSTEQTSDFV